MAIAETHPVTLAIEQWLAVLEKLSVPGKRTVAHSNLRYLLIRSHDRSWYEKPREEQVELFLTAEERSVLRKAMEKRDE